jgi:hypothetical protein
MLTRVDLKLSPNRRSTGCHHPIGKRYPFREARIDDAGRRHLQFVARTDIGGRSL